MSQTGTMPGVAPLDELPIDAELPRILDLVDRKRALVVVAPPGSGKTTRVPPALLAAGPLLLLEPRRLAARSIARRIASEQGLTLGQQIGWQVRFERHFTGETRLLVATEGILTRRLQADPLLSGFATVVLDEFHERSIHADLALALLSEARAARPDLRVVVMSATLDAGPVARFLGDCPVLEATGRTFAVEVEYAPGEPFAAAVRRVTARASGHVLAFLPGAPEIRRAERELGATLGEAVVLPLHGTLDAAAQDLVLAPSSRRKVVLATNVAESSLTIDGVTEVVDSGLVKVLRFDPTTGLDRLETERVSVDSADQRAGRAGRTAPGRATRLWDGRDILRPHREADIQRIDLSGPLLDLVAWGGDPSACRWFEAPSPVRVEAALELLRSLGAIEGRKLTPVGRALHRWPLPPRLGRFLLEAGGGERACRVAALLAERRTTIVPGEPATTDSDVLSLVDRWREMPASVQSAARELARLTVGGLGPGGSPNSALPESSRGESDDERLRRALFLAFPDRLARRRSPLSPRLLLASGRGAILGRESGVRTAEYVVALDVTELAMPGDEALVRLATAVDRDWITATTRETVHHYDEAARAVRAALALRFGAIVLAEKPVPPDPERAAPLLVEALRAQEPEGEWKSVLARLRFSGLEADLETAFERACARGRPVCPTSRPSISSTTRLAGVSIGWHRPPCDCPADVE